jgi:hypothetical protein
MSFVDCSLPYFRQQLITCPLSALLPFQPLFTESSHGDQLLANPPFSSALTAPRPLCYVLVFCSLFTQFFGFLFLGFFAGWGVSLSRGYVGLSQGWLWEYHMMFGAHLLVC